MTNTDPYASVLKELANTMLGVARESVTLVKRADPQQAIRLNRSQEWNVYLEFLQVLFNLADRLSAFYIPVQDQPEFMNRLEDTVADQLKTVLAPTLSSAEIDDMEIVLSIGQAVAQSRQTYERFRFVVTEQSKERDQLFEYFSQRVAEKAGASNNTHITSAALLCVSAVVPALQRLFEDMTKSQTSEATTEASSSSVSPGESSSDRVSAEGPSSVTPEVPTIKLVKVVSRISKDEIETTWGVHPRFQRDLKPHEAKELAQHMNRVARILGERFAAVAALAQASEDQRIGHA